ncbi:hypothetical protein OCGS_2182 [Oceaniovalibus guishaninsula JLT2003]|uniref:Uncharacterized protein n=1 Tax=Oceaniovalibus guishaninsula JLT2003 TaxID=1231392 RepID=K2H8B2_9RHOB|nr:hypothetical protein OCGS_2182 [Oceaniovalibus guishaninsula JLT2003]
MHGSYLWYLSHVPHEIVMPIREGRPEGYGGRLPGFAWPDNLSEVPAEAVKDMQFDAVLTQSHRNWTIDRHEILSAEQLRLPRLHLEHDPPLMHPTEERHPVDDPGALLVHVTAFNELMWDSGRTPTRVIEHGVTVPDDAVWTGERPRGITVVNDLPTRGRRIGADVFQRARDAVPLDLLGMGSTAMGGLGQVPLADLPYRLADYRFFFNPIRYTSLGLAVCEAMMAGLPIVGLATTEMSSAVENGVSGWVDTREHVLHDHMRRLIADPAEARMLSQGAARIARQRFGIDRFVADWCDALAEVTGIRPIERMAAHA